MHKPFNVSDYSKYDANFVRSELHDYDVYANDSHIKLVMSERLLTLKQSIIDFLVKNNALPHPWVVSHISDIVLEMESHKHSVAENIALASSLYLLGSKVEL